MRRVLPSPARLTVALRALSVCTSLEHLRSFTDCALIFPVLINHFLDDSLFGLLIPDRLAAPTTNSIASCVSKGIWVSYRLTFRLYTE
jgi:hypothetical protein